MCGYEICDSILVEPSFLIRAKDIFLINSGGLDRVDLLFMYYS